MTATSLQPVVGNPLDGKGAIITWHVKPNKRCEVTIEALNPGKFTVSYAPVEISRKNKKTLK